MESTFNLIDLVQLLKSKWRVLLSFTLLSAMLAAIIVFIMTPQYKSSTTLLAGNPQLSDKARLFNQQIKDLYTNFGSGDDLDRIQAFAEMDNTLLEVVHKNELIAYFDLPKSDSTSGFKATELLRKKLHFIKTDKDQLIISCLSTNKNLSAKIVNDIAEVAELSLRKMIQENNQQIIHQLDSTVIILKEKYNQIAKNNTSNDAASKRLNGAELETIIDQLDQTQKASQEFRIASETMPHFIQVMEKGIPASEINWPNKPLIITVAALLGLVFSAIVILSKHQMKQI
ncbi:MAG: Wzz/FepE/Etk N-terminal domain-containing protein [Sphingobacteriia bacterium]|jgi:uncharacterized protein involved in exopolysaccharide biosynthesis